MHTHTAYPQVLSDHTVRTDVGLMMITLFNFFVERASCSASVLRDYKLLTVLLYYQNVR